MHFDERMRERFLGRSRESRVCSRSGTDWLESVDILPLVNNLQCEGCNKGRQEFYGFESGDGTPAWTYMRITCDCAFDLSLYLSSMVQPTIFSILSSRSGTAEARLGDFSNGRL